MVQTGVPYDDDDRNLISTEGGEWLPVSERENKVAASSGQDQGSLLQIIIMTNTNTIKNTNTNTNTNDHLGRDQGSLLQIINITKTFIYK